MLLNPFPPREHERGRDADCSFAGMQGGADPERNTAEPPHRVPGGSRRGIPDRLGEAGNKSVRRKALWARGVRVCLQGTVFPRGLPSEGLASQGDFPLHSMDCL